MPVLRSEERGFKSPMTKRDFCNHNLITNVALGIFMTMRANKNLYSRLIHDSPLQKNLVWKERIGREGRVLPPSDFSPSA